MKNRTEILDNSQVIHRIDRIAYQIFEDNFNEEEIIIAGIARSGYIFAKRLEKALAGICNLKTVLVEVSVDKENPVNLKMKPALSKEELKNRVVIVTDDVLNSGKTLIYSLRPFLDADIKKIRTALLVNRDHKRYPVEADFVGISLSTTLNDHITVDLTPGRESVVLD
jgi:pyrimidine operon attenuation protein / uracil phosphoribosyltransferase